MGLGTIFNPRKHSKLNGYAIHSSSASACSRVITVTAMKKTRTPRSSLLDCWCWRRQRILEKNTIERKTQDITSDKNLKVEMNANALTLHECACSDILALLPYSRLAGEITRRLAKLAGYVELDAVLKMMLMKFHPIVLYINAVDKKTNWNYINDTTIT